MTKSNMNGIGRRRGSVSTTALCLASAWFSASGCYSGKVNTTLEDLVLRDLDGVATPGEGRPEPVRRVPRDEFGESNLAENLVYPGAPEEAVALFDPLNRNRAIGFFINEHSHEEGVGPHFNQTRCLGCHESHLDNFASFNGSDTSGDRIVHEMGELPRVATIVSRGHRSGVTDYSRIGYDDDGDEVSVPPPRHADALEDMASEDGIASRSNRNVEGRPPTAAFTLFGDFNLGSGVYNPLPEFGGPLIHYRATENCPIEHLPPFFIDANLNGELVKRTHGERAAPPYIGRGLMEAIYFEDLLRHQDPEDERSHESSHAIQPSPVICGQGDCISGRVNLGHPDAAFLGGEPVLRVARFGLRAAGATMSQFDVGGTHGELSMTSPIASSDQTNPFAVHDEEFPCDEVRDPEIEVDVITSLRATIRMVAPAELHEDLLEDGGDMSASVADGAALFGLDLERFRELMDIGDDRADADDPDLLNLDHAISEDRGLNCVGCHIPVMTTGQSPAAIGADMLSNKWINIFSDLLIHDMGGRSLRDDPQDQTPITLASGDECTPIERDLSDFALPGQGVANGREFRTPPLFSVGRVGPPFLHDARVFLNPENPGCISAANANGEYDLVIRTVEEAVLAVIEMHDLPAPPGNDYANCPTTTRPAGPVPEDDAGAASQAYHYDAEYDYCTRESPNRSEARVVVERWRALSPEDQMSLVRFILSL